MLRSAPSDAFGNPGAGDFMKAVTNVALKFLYLGIAAVVGSYLEAAVWMYTGNRQTNRLRTRFLKAVLAQEVAFFDVESTTGGVGCVATCLCLGPAVVNSMPPSPELPECC
jgi:ATP-binding cassette subfamily B (MDR/TAP) protein 1